MPKKGFLLKDVPPILVSAKDKPGWALCVGAGTSIPIFPDWYSLAEQLANQLIPDKPFDLLTIKKSGFSPDAIIQMVKNLSNLSDIEFAHRMSDVLYSKLKSKIPEKFWPDVCEVLGANIFSNCTVSKWRAFSLYRDTVFNTTSAYKIAPIILEAIRKDNRPQCILSFNAEPLLYAILNSFLMDGCNQVPKKLFSKVISSVSNYGLETIPYVFCHGLLPVTNNPHKFSTSVDKLVFLEEEYLRIANNSFSWQATMFLDACVSQHIVFIGTSLSDPNMRRWLSWTHANRLDEMKKNGIDIKDSTQHYWIRTIPDNRKMMPWIESAVSHLGVRIVWIECWDQVDSALGKMLGLFKEKPTPKKKIRRHKATKKSAEERKDVRKIKMKS